MNIFHIPHLPISESACALLQRVCKEFEPIIERRKYNVRSVSEMCCCGDGLDTATTTKRKKKIMARNVWGYNQTTFRSKQKKQHTIHLRLRHPSEHNRLLVYEDVAGTMAHELAHCEIGPHNDKFNKLMEEILEEHMLLQCKQVVAGGGRSSSKYLYFPGKGIPLGKQQTEDNNNNNNTTTTNIFNPRNPGYKLGGDNVFSNFLSPKEAACLAAEARRRQQTLRAARGDHCCQPCTITIPDSDDDENSHDHDNDGASDKKDNTRRNNTHPYNNDKKRPAVMDTNHNNTTSHWKDTSRKKRPNKKQDSKNNNTTSGGNETIVIDLTTEEKGTVRTTTTDAANYKDSIDIISVPQKEEEEWACKRCTFHNPPLALACQMCAGWNT